MDSHKGLPRPVFATGMRGFVFLALLSLIITVNISASVLVAPTVVILSERDNTGRITVQNPSDKPKEVSIHLSFGLPLSDSTGDIRLQLQDSGVTDSRCAMGWIKAFPSKIILKPGESQVVRLRATPPKNLADGEYWARIVVRAQEGAISIPAASQADKISTKLNMVMQTAIMMKYRTGNLVSKLEVTKSEAILKDSAVQVTIAMTNRGNVSYVGSLNCRLLDAQNKVVSSDRIDLAVYYDLTRRIKLPLKREGFVKPYKVDVSISTDGRTDLAAADLILGNSINYALLISQL